MADRLGQKLEEKQEKKVRRLISAMAYKKAPP